MPDKGLSEIQVMDEFCPLLCAGLKSLFHFEALPVDLKCVKRDENSNSQINDAAPSLNSARSRTHSRKAKVTGTIRRQRLQQDSTMKTIVKQPVQVQIKTAKSQKMGHNIFQRRIG